MGALKQIDTVVDSVAGKISVSLRRDEHAFSLALHSPKGTTAQVWLPCGLTPSPGVTVNGRLIWKSGRATGNVKGVEFKETADGWMRFEVAPGDWKFELTTAD
jgi:hypothetical protein